MDVAEIYDAYVDKVYRFFYIKCLDKTIAEDLTSQTFMVFVERANDPDYVIADAKKFVYGVMRNVWLMYLRRKYQRNEQTVEDIDDFEAYVDDELTDYDALTVKQRAEVYINKLPDRQREIVTLRLLAGQSIREICQITSKDTNYVKTTYKRGLKSLKRLVAEQEVI